MFRSMVVGTDGSETANEAVRQSAELARALGAEVHLVSSYNPLAHPRRREERVQASDDPQRMVDVRENFEAALHHAAEGMRKDGLVVATHVREGDPADAILDVAEETGADLIVVGNKGMTGPQRFLLGSVPNRVSHEAPCSVLIIRTT